MLIDFGKHINFKTMSKYNRQINMMILIFMMTQTTTNKITTTFKIFKIIHLIKIIIITWKVSINKTINSYIMINIINKNKQENLNMDRKFQIIK